MDPHVKVLADTLRKAGQETGGEIYDVLTFDDDGNPIESCPALKTSLNGRTLNVLLFDVPGNRDHFSIVLNAEPQVHLTLREEVRWDFVLKTLGRVEDHIIGIDDFDRRYLIGGRPPDRVKVFLRGPQVREAIKSLEPFLNLSFDDGFVRASFPLTPATRWSWSDLQARIDVLVRLAEAAEALPTS